MLRDANGPIESADDVFVAVLDETYGDYDEGHQWDAAREAFRLGLIDEFGFRFEDANVGPGADIPAFATLIHPLTLNIAAAVGVIAAGKAIRDGVDGYLDLAKRLHKLFGRRIYLNRNGAIVLALEAVTKDVGSVPHVVQVTGYAAQHIGEPDDLESLDPLTEIADAVGTIYLGMVRHIVEIDVDGMRYRASVEGKDVKILRLRPM